MSEKRESCSSCLALLQLDVARHSLFWLAAANLVGVLCAALLVWPQGNTWLGVFTYGRWMPLHMNWQLYGWCSLPIVGMLLRGYGIISQGNLEAARTVLWLWSLALAIGASEWLGGEVSGKLFLDATGLSRLLLPAAMLFLWAVLAWQWQVYREPQKWFLLLKGLMLAGLFGVPFAIYIYHGADVYPPVNPNSGGPTGTALVHSTLAVVVLMLVTGSLLGLDGEEKQTRWAWWANGSLLLLNLCAYPFLAHGDVSHQEIMQIVGVGSLLFWVPMLAWLLEGWGWQEGSRRWVRAALVWWALLCVDGLVMFLPGMLERYKFTNALVAHAHLAMAAFVTSLLMAVLMNLYQSEQPTDLSRALGKASRFWLWQIGIAAYVIAMLVIGSLEAASPQVLFYGQIQSQWLYGIRLLAGVAMSVASLSWLIASLCALSQNDNLEPF